jgi:type I restriction enzyme S subunit
MQDINAKLPDNWKILKLEDTCELIMGQSPPGESYNENGEGFPFLQGKAEFTDTYPIHIKFTTKPIKIAPQGTVLMSVRAPVGDVNIANIDYCIGRGLASISLKDGDNTFLFYILKFLKNDISKEGTGSTFQAINKSKLNEIVIPLPSMFEQQKISYVLSAVQEAKEKTGEVIRAAKELKKSLMNHLFTYGPVPPQEAPNVKLKETEIGLIPADWKVIPFEYLVKESDGIKRGPWGGSIKKDMFVPKGFKIYEQGNVIANDFTKGNYFIDDKKFNELKDFDVKPGDVLITAAGTIGKLAIVPDNIHKGIINQALIRIRLKEDIIDTLFFKFVFDFMVNKNIFASYSHGATLKNLSSIKILRNVLFVLPPIEIQNEIIDILMRADQKIEAEENKKTALDNLFKTLLENLMTGKTRVNHLDIPIKTTNTTEQP